MATIVTVTEKDLFEFEAFCDRMYDDNNCRRDGFFKFKLHSDCAKQSSSMSDFYNQFGIAAQRKIAKAVILSNPNDKSLFGHLNIAPTSSEKETFLTESFNPDAFEDIGTSPNCCMKIFHEEGEDAFLQHFYSEVTSGKSKDGETKQPANMQQILNRSVTKAVAFQKRQRYQQAVSMEEKGRILETAMLLEKFHESSSAECCCESCNLLTVAKLTRDNLKPLLYSANIEEKGNNYLHITKNFAMAHLCFKNMLADLDSAFPGVSYPALYLGGLHSVFPIHIEDLSLWSMNFNLHGHPKFWLIVPPTAVKQLSDALFSCGFNGHNKWCRNTLGHKFYIPTVNWLKRENIPHKVVIQYEGEGVVVLPNAGHTGGNMGANCAEACNFGTERWILYGCVSANCPCMENAVHADLSDIVAVHKRDILKAYLSNDILKVAKDRYFLQSNLIHDRREIVDTSLTSNSSTTVTTASLSPPSTCDRTSSHCTSSKKIKLEANPSATTRVKCPICNVSWAYVQKKNILAHLHKYHSGRLDEEIVLGFLVKNSMKRS